MTFTRTPKSPTNFLAHKHTTSDAEEVLLIRIDGASVQLPSEDAQAFAQYILGHWPEDSSN